MYLFIIIVRALTNHNSIMFYTEIYVYSYAYSNIQIDGVVVDRVHVTKFLGVLVDD